MGLAVISFKLSLAFPVVKNLPGRRYVSSMPRLPILISLRHPPPPFFSINEGLTSSQWSYLSNDAPESNLSCQWSLILKFLLTLRSPSLPAPCRLGIRLRIYSFIKGEVSASLSRGQSWEAFLLAIYPGTYRVPKEWLLSWGPHHTDTGLLVFWYFQYCVRQANELILNGSEWHILKRW